jgi:spore germination protein (amino acid permease)
MMVVLTAPIAFLETPKHLNYILLNNAWLAAFAGLIPGILLAAMFKAIIEKSRSPFPLMLEEHLGVVPGKLLGFIYILFFLLVAGYSLRHFIDFIITNVLPATPISVLTGIMLLLGVAAIKGGLEGFSRVNEVIVSIGLPFTLIIIFSHMGQHHNIENLLPFADMSLKSFGLALFYSLYALGKLMAVLSLAFFCPDKKHLGTCLYSVVITFIMVTGLTTLATNLGFGGIYNVFQTFPVFSLVRSIKIGEFIQNIDIVFIGIWIMGIFASATIPGLWPVIPRSRF